MRTVEIPQDSIDVMKESATSLMPRGLLKDVSDAQVDDLLAYLGSLPDDKPFDLSQTTLIAHSHGGGASSRRVRFDSMVDDAGRFPEVDAEFVLTTVPQQMRYDQPTLRVKPGSKIRLTLRNADEMNHNLVVCRPGKLTWFDVAKAAWALGPDGPKRGFIPDSDLIVAATYVVPRGRQHTIDFQVPDEEALPYVFDLLKSEGLCLGGSSGINIAGAVKMANEMGPGHTIVTILADYGTRYQSKLFNPEFLKEKGLPFPDWLE